MSKPTEALSLAASNYKEQVDTPEDDLVTFTAACNTLKASSWEFFKARVFGKTVTAMDGDLEVTMACYKGKYYHIKHREV